MNIKTKILNAIKGINYLIVETILTIKELCRI